MPYLALPRRRFLRTALLGGAASAISLPAADSATARWALFSDTHVPGDPNMIARGFRPHENARRAVQEALKISPDGAAICGDLARTSGLLEDYQALRQILQPLSRVAPVAMAMGNHDDRDTFLKVFADHPGESAGVAKKHVLILQTAGVRFILLDSLLFVNKTPGLLGVAQRTWLQKYLQNGGNSPVLLFLHHTLADNDSALLDAGRFLDLIQPFRQVKAVFYGHSHRLSFDQSGGIHLVNLPATGYNFGDPQPVGWMEAKVSRQGAGLTLHAVAGHTADDGKTTFLRWRS
ncbi:MAG: metallophosphoesterase [Bryobacteraceae bacterium]